MRFSENFEAYHQTLWLWYDLTATDVFYL